MFWKPFRLVGLSWRFLPAEAGVEYVDSNAYEAYEKQEGDFVDNPESAEPPPESEQAEGEAAP